MKGEGRIFVEFFWVEIGSKTCWPVSRASLLNSFEVAFVSIEDDSREVAADEE